LSGWGRGSDGSDTGVSSAPAAVTDVVVAAAAAAVPEAVVFTVVLAPPASAAAAASPGASGPRNDLPETRACPRTSLVLGLTPRDLPCCCY